MLADRKENRDILKVIVLAAALSGISFYLQHNIGINLADEGYLLYGTMQTLAGKVPIRDFFPYDPGRYYWMAAWSLLFGEGLTAMRFYLAVFGAIGVSFGLLAARRAVRSFWGLLPLGVLLTLWMFPRFHPFEMTFAMGTVFFSLRLLEAPTPRRYLSAGVFTGLAAFFGRNVGLYGFLAITSITLYIWRRGTENSFLKTFLPFLAGIFLGYSPMLLMIIFVPGCFHAFLDSIFFYIRHKSTNLPLPIPWPWLAISKLHSSTPVMVLLHDFFLGLFFLFMPMVYLVCLVKHFFIKKEDARHNALLTASLVTGVFYMHYTFSRADINHLARGIHPLILAIVALVCLQGRGLRRTVSIALATLFLVVSSYYTVVLESPFYKKNVAQKGLYIEYPIRGEKIWMPRWEAVMINTIERIERERVAPDEWLFLAPYIPTMYYVLARESPTRTIYFLFAGTPDEQKRVISELEGKRVPWAIVGDIPLDGIDERRFSRSYEMVWRYLQQNYVLVDPLWNIPGYVLIQRREGSGENRD